MKAVLFRAHGGPVNLSYEDLPVPTIGPEDVLVRVKACALNHLTFRQDRDSGVDLEWRANRDLSGNLASEMCVTSDAVECRYDLMSRSNVLSWEQRTGLSIRSVVATLAWSVGVRWQFAHVLGERDYDGSDRC